MEVEEHDANTSGGHRQGLHLEIQVKNRQGHSTSRTVSAACGCNDCRELRKLLGRQVEIIHGVYAGRPLHS